MSTIGERISVGVYEGVLFEGDVEGYIQVYLLPVYVLLHNWHVVHLYVNLEGSLARLVLGVIALN